MLWILGSILLLIALLLLLPLEVEVDTSSAIYRARWVSIVGIRGVPCERSWHWYFKVFFWEKEWKPKLPKTRTTPKKQPTKKSKQPTSPKKIWALVKNLFRAVKVKRLRVNWDTGDFIRNAQLYPLFRALSRRGRHLNINFMGQEELEILLQTRLWNIAGAFLRSFVFT